MTHRAQQIVDAIATLVRTRVEPSGVHVYTHRRESLSAEQDELPAVSIDYGGDNPASIQVLSEYRSVLDVQASMVVQASTPDELHEQLFRLRGDVHIAVMGGDMRLGLPFVIAVLYGPVEPPEITMTGSKHTAELRSSWQVHYSMDLTDPNN